MAKETQKEKIARLEQEVEELTKSRNESWEREQQASNKILELENSVEQQFKQTGLYKQMQREIENLKAENALNKGHIKAMEELRYRQAERIEQLQRTLEKAENRLPVHNERGAGRKQRFNGAEIEQIKMMRAGGKTIREIAEYMNCSAGLIHKIINEKS